MTQTFSYSGTSVVGGVHILTDAEAAVALRCEVTDTNMLQLLPLVDKYIEMATGRDWTIDATIYPEAKSAARMLLVRWHEDPGGMVSGDTLGPGIRACLTQLEAKALELATSGVPSEALDLVGYVPAAGSIAATTITPVLIFNHEMTTGALAKITLEDSGGVTVASAVTKDATNKLITITPTVSLAASSGYTIVVDYAMDIYGLTYSTTIGFTTA